VAGGCVVSSTNRGANRDGFDRYYTDPHLAESLVDLVGLSPRSLVVEPGIGAGAFARACMGRGCSVVGIDVDPEADGLTLPGLAQSVLGDVTETSIEADWYIGNPPYKHAEAHVRHALQHSAIGCAFLLRLAFLESAGRWPFWAMHPASEVHVFAKRPSFTGGKTDSCAYAWFIWRHTHRGPASIFVLPPTFGGAP
jgi:hypothetical protein